MIVNLCVDEILDNGNVIYSDNDCFHYCYLALEGYNVIFLYFYYIVFL